MDEMIQELMNNFAEGRIDEIIEELENSGSETFKKYSEEWGRLYDEILERMPESGRKVVEDLQEFDAQFKFFMFCYLFGRGYYEGFTELCNEIVNMPVIPTPLDKMELTNIEKFAKVREIIVAKTNQCMHNLINIEEYTKRKNKHKEICVQIDEELPDEKKKLLVELNCNSFRMQKIGMTVNFANGVFAGVLSRGQPL